MLSSELGMPRKACVDQELFLISCTMTVSDVMTYSESRAINVIVIMAKTGLFRRRLM
jgi:hypothetical protein